MATPQHPRASRRGPSAARRARPQPFLVSALTLALRALPTMAGAAVLTTGAQAQAQTAPVAEIAFTIAPGPLDATLGAFGRAAQINVAADPELTAGRDTAGLQGRYPIDQGLRQLLSGTGLMAVPAPAGGYLLRRLPVAQGDASVLEPVMVVGSHEVTTEGTGSYTSGATSIAKGAQSLRDIPQSISVVTRQRLDEQSLTSIYDALANTTGITLQQSPQAGKYVYSRGFRNTSYQYDGIPLDRSMYGRASNFGGGTAIYDRVEVLRGAAGLLQGGGEPGGAVNLVRKRALPEAGFSVIAKAGQWDHYGMQVDGGGPLNESGTLRGRAVVDYETRGSYVDYANNRDQTFYGTLEYDLTPDTRASVGFSSETSRGRPNMRGFPAYDDGSPLDVSRAYYMGADWNRRNSTTETFYFDLSHRFNDNWQGRVAAIHLRERHDMKFNSPIREAAAGTNISATAADITEADIGITGVDANLLGKIDAFGRTHELVLGANYARNDVNTDYGSINDYWVGNVYDYRPGSIPEPTKGQLYANFREHRDGRGLQYGVYGAARLQLADPLKLVLGGRVSWYDTIWDTRTTGSRYSENSTYGSRENGKFTPYAGLLYDLSPQWTAYASYTDIFKPQSEKSSSGRPLDPLLGTNYEIGLKGELLDGRINTAIALFRVDQKNRAQTDYRSSPDCDAGWYCSIAAGKVRSQGVDAEISGEILRGWNLFAGYTFNTTRYLEDETNQGKPLNSLTPKHMLRVWTTYKLAGAAHRWTLGGGVNAQTSSYDAGTIRVNSPGYAIWSAYARYQINNHWAASVNLNNLFDKTYYTSVGSNNGNFYGEPRNVMLTLRGDF